ncbi:MAG: trypsin-like peptidase domain-containing protein [Planctomycetes bacterium]|nr:trypsin-like peptidase domain-containing protein [Planctomycetota bacterium]
MNAAETDQSVVAKTADREQGNPQAPGRSPFGGRNPFEGTPFGDLFKDTPFGDGFRFEMPPGDQVPHGGGLGSGVIIDPSGLVLTNNHVVAGGGQVSVRLYDGREFSASQVWTDPKTDIAVVKLDGAKDLTAAKLGNSDMVSIGDWVLALGQPFGLESTVTAGIISAKHRGIGITARDNFLQTDAAINPGNSGGPLVNLNGEVIGVNTAISSRSGGNDGIGFAIPINLAKWVANQLAKEGVVHRAYLGVGIQPVSQKLADQFHVKPREGVVVTDVFPNTPAAKAGVKSGDVIVEFAGVAVSSPQELQTLVEQAQMG